MSAHDSDPPASGAFTWPVRVYYEDTDAAAVVYYANYLKYMERARTEWLRALGFEQTLLSRGHGVVFVVRALAIDYLLPARFDDALEVTMKLIEARGCLMRVAQSIRRGAQTLTTAEVKLACVNTLSFKPARIPGAILERIAMRKA
jgi:acyl-CoA thioester hydrolase